MRRRIVSWETPYACATVGSGSFCSTTRCTTVGHCPVGRLYAGCFGPGRRCLITQEEGFPQLFPLQQAGVAPSDTVFLSGQGRESKLVTEDSKPVGSGLIIYSSFSYYKKLRSFASTSPACAGSRVSARSHTPFSETLLLPPLPPNSARMGLPFVLFSHQPRTDRPRSQHRA